MSRYITPHAEAEIVAWLGDWEAGLFGNKLTWDLVEKTFDYSRQALNKNTIIKQAYEKAKDAIRQKVNPKTENDKLNEQLQKAKKRIEELEELKGKYEAQWITWVYNAAMRGVTEEDLNKPMAKGFKDSQRDKK